MNTKLAVAGILSGLVGFVIIGINSNIWIALGVFLMITGNNFEQLARR